MIESKLYDWFNKNNLIMNRKKVRQISFSLKTTYFNRLQFEP